MFFIFFPCVLFSLSCLVYLSVVLEVWALIFMAGDRKRFAGPLSGGGRESVLGRKEEKSNPAKILHKNMDSFQSSIERGGTFGVCVSDECY